MARELAGVYPAPCRRTQTALAEGSIRDSGSATPNAFLLSFRAEREISYVAELQISPRGRNDRRTNLDSRLKMSGMTGLRCSRSKDLRKNNLINIAPRFGSDLDGTIEKHLRHSTAMVRGFRLRPVQRWPEDWMRDCSSYFLAGLKLNCRFWNFLNRGREVRRVGLARL